MRGMMRRKPLLLFVVLCLALSAKLPLLTGRWYRNLGSIALVRAMLLDSRKGQYENSTALLEKALRKDRESWPELALSYFLGGDYLEASNVIERMGAESVQRKQFVHPDLESAYFHLRVGQEYLAQDQYEDAVRHFSLALNRAPLDPVLLYYLSEAYEESGCQSCAAEIAQRLKHYQLGQEEGLRQELPAVAQKLVKAGIWSETEVRQLASFLAWQGTPDQVESMLESFESKYPGTIHSARMIATQRELSQPGLSIEGCAGRGPEERFLRDARVLASFLSISDEEIFFGDNLLVDGDFESTALWYWSWIGWGSGQGFFLGDHDRFDKCSGRQSLRIQGFWVEGNPGRGYLSRGVRLEADAIYVLSFWYKTRWLDDENARVALAAKDPARTFLGSGYRLPSTSDQWSKVVVFGSNDSSEVVRVVLRNYGEGIVWFDDVQLAKAETPRYIGHLDSQMFVFP